MHNRETAESLLAQVLECGVLDVSFAIDLANNNDIEIDIEDIKGNYGSLNINIIIYELIYTVAEKFIDENIVEIEKILNVRNLNDYRDNNELYEIFTNYMDSHLWFKDEKIQMLFEKSRFEV